MGSGETAPTMVTPHREIVARLGDPAPRAVLLDTPYGFQENASEITERAVEYFGHRVQLTIEAAGFLGPLAADQTQRTPIAEAAALSRLRTAGFVFAGPGSPSYALSVWRGSPVPEALTTKLANGGAVVFSSAAALTLGRFSIPVYEIYKVGLPVHWLDGLDLLRAAGFEGSCVVIPHYDNAEGGTHDTRFCYLGERRLVAMEAMLPDDAWVLGIDEHTVLMVDLDARTAVVSGRGGGGRAPRSSRAPGSASREPHHAARRAAGRQGVRARRSGPRSIDRGPDRVARHAGRHGLGAARVNQGSRRRCARGALHIGPFQRTAQRRASGTASCIDRVKDRGAARHRPSVLMRKCRRFRDAARE